MLKLFFPVPKRRNTPYPKLDFEFPNDVIGSQVGSF